MIVSWWIAWSGGFNMVSPRCLVCEWGWLKSWTQLELHVASLARWPQGSLLHGNSGRSEGEDTNEQS